MKKVTFIVVLVACVFLGLPAANAAMLGVELIYPDILTNQTGFYAYTWDADSQEGLFSARALPLTIHRGGLDLQSITGEVTDLGWENIENTKLVLFDFTFDVNGGTLASEFETGLGADIALAENSDFADDWQVNHESIKVKHDTAPVGPIPATAGLIGVGLIGMVALRRRFKS